MRLFFLLPSAMATNFYAAVATPSSHTIQVPFKLEVGCHGAVYPSPLTQLPVKSIPLKNIQLLGQNYRLAQSRVTLDSPCGVEALAEIKFAYYGSGADEEDQASPGELEVKFEARGQSAFLKLYFPFSQFYRIPRAVGSLTCVTRTDGGRCVDVFVSVGEKVVADPQPQPKAQVSLEEVPISTPVGDELAPQSLSF